MNRPRLFRIPGPRIRGRILTIAKMSVVIAAVLTLISVNVCTALSLSLFLLIGQAAVLLGTGLALFVAATDFLRTRGMSEVRFEAGETIIHQGDQGDFAYVIVRGEADAFRVEPDGSETFLSTMGPGQLFGEVALVSDAPRAASVRARTDMEAVTMARSDFTTLYAYVPNLRRHVEKVMKKRAKENRKKVASAAKLGVLLVGCFGLGMTQETWADGNVSEGKRLYGEHLCAQCHGPEGKGDGYLLPMLKESPPMTDWTQAAKMKEMRDEFLIEIIEKGGEGVGKSDVMLKYGHKIERPQVVNIVAFIRSLPKD